jgi:hypothetical protein
MKLLFQGGWKPGRDRDDAKALTERYCLALAKRVAMSHHQLLLGSPGPSEQIIAEELAQVLGDATNLIKDRLLYLLPARFADIPKRGRVMRLDDTPWWQDERTMLVQRSDALIAIGGGKATADCIQKALLASKPVFVAGAIPGQPAAVWKRRAPGLYYLKEGDTEFTEDLTNTPDDFVDQVFRVLHLLEAPHASRRRDPASHQHPVEMVGQQMQSLRDALCSAFDQASLDQMLRFSLDKDRPKLVADGPFHQVTFELIKIAQREGWHHQLIDAACKYVPGNAVLQLFRKQYPQWGSQ